MTSDLPQVTFRIFDDGIGIAVETPEVKDSLTPPKSAVRSTPAPLELVAIKRVVKVMPNYQRLVRLIKRRRPVSGDM